MRKKLYLRCLAAMTAAVFVLGLPSCSSNDSGEGDNNNSIIIGTWMGPRLNNSGSVASGLSMTLVFNSDGSGRYIEDNRNSIQRGTFTYKMEGITRGKLLFDNADDNYIEVIDNKMFFYDHGYGDDLDYILTKQ